MNHPKQRAEKSEVPGITDFVLAAPEIVHAMALPLRLIVVTTALLPVRVVERDSSL